MAPGALVIGGHFQGLGIMKSLSLRGVSVYVADSELSVGRFSRYKDGFFRIPPARDEKAVVAKLLEAGQAHGLDGYVVYANEDDMARVLSRNKSLLEPLYRVPQPPWSALEKAYDKRRTYDLAAQAGVPTPGTRYPKDRDELAALNLTFPVIVKPAIRDHFYDRTKTKALRADDMPALLKAYDRATQIISPEEVMVQDLIPGGTGNLFSVGCFFRSGQMVGKVVAQRHRQHPMDFGHATTYAETVALPEAEELATRILGAIDYYGVAEVEFMKDPRDGVLKLIEINGRFWGWHTLAIAAGVDLPYLLYADMCGLPVPETNGYRIGSKWLRPVTDLPTVGLELAKRRMGFGGYLRSLRGISQLAPPLSLHDPLPFVMEFILVPYLWAKRGF